RPDWRDEDGACGAIKVVMTGQAHIRNKPRREALANRFRDAADPLRIVLVRDMWLTGFDAPCMHTMYIDKAHYIRAVLDEIFGEARFQNEIASASPSARTPNRQPSATHGSRPAVCVETRCIERRRSCL